jgi:hypothetical protein
MKPPQRDQRRGNEVDANSGKSRFQVLVSIGAKSIDGSQRRRSNQHREHDESQAEEPRLLDLRVQFHGCAAPDRSCASRRLAAIVKNDRAPGCTMNLGVVGEGP